MSVLRELNVNSGEARAIFKCYPHVGNFMAWANKRSRHLKRIALTHNNRRKTSDKIEKALADDIHKAVCSKGVVTSIKFLDAHGQDILSPDLISIINKHDIPQFNDDSTVLAVAITGSIRHPFKTMAKSSKGLVVGEPTMVNLGKAAEFGIVPVLLYYDSMGEIRSLKPNADYKKRISHKRKVRVYSTSSFRPGFVSQKVRLIVDEFFRNLKHMALNNVAAFDSVIDLYMTCVCGSTQRVAITKPFDVSKRVRCVQCGSRGVVSWDDIFKFVEQKHARQTSNTGVVDAQRTG